MPKLMSKNAEILKKIKQELVLKWANDAYADINDDPKALKEQEEELALWESTLNDGLDDE
jgi:hypothetical protein